MAWRFIFIYKFVKAREGFLSLPSKFRLKESLTHAVLVNYIMSNKFSQAIKNARHPVRPLCKEIFLCIFQKNTVMREEKQDAQRVGKETYRRRGRCFELLYHGRQKQSGLLFVEVLPTKLTEQQGS